MPSILQSISWSPSGRRMLLTLAARFTTGDHPFTFRSLITVTVSPSVSGLPTKSLITLAPAGAALVHSCPLSGQVSIGPSSQASKDSHPGQAGRSFIPWALAPVASGATGPGACPCHASARSPRPAGCCRDGRRPFWHGPGLRGRRRRRSISIRLPCNPSSHP